MLRYSRFAAKVVALIIHKLRQEAKPGLTGKDLERLAVSIIKEKKVKSSSLGYNNFPASICVSVNNELTHGIPTDNPFKHGDLVSVDVACSYHGFHADAASTFIIEEKEVDKKTYDQNNFLKKKLLLEVTENSLLRVIQKIIPGKTMTAEIGHHIESYVRERGFFVIKELGGHGIGRMLHMNPFIPNFKTTLNNEMIKPGMLICIEPLVQINNDLIKKSKNGFTIESFDGSLNAHFEHTLLVREKDLEILTIMENLNLEKVSAEN